MTGKSKKPTNLKSGPHSGFHPGRDMWAGLMFLTRLPLPASARMAAPPSAASFWCFPLVGAVIGLMGGGVYGLAVLANLGTVIAALLALAATLALTGALHEDGLADAADGLWGGHDAERRLAIMRDSRTGVFGAAALFFSLTLRAAALVALADPLLVLSVWVAVHGLSRGQMVGWAALFAPATSTGLAAGFGRPPRSAGLAALLLGLAVAVGCLGPALGWLWAGLACIFCLAGGSLLMLVARRKLGGYTGDVLGAAQQVGEITLLLACTALLESQG